MAIKEITPHESIELHEILTFKNVCLTKSVAMPLLVSDNELKSILQQDADLTQRQIKELRELMVQTNGGNDVAPNTNALS